MSKYEYVSQSLLPRRWDHLACSTDPNYFILCLEPPWNEEMESWRPGGKKVMAEPQGRVQDIAIAINTGKAGLTG